MNIPVPTCSVAACQKPGSFLSGKCKFHEALASARELSQGDFDLLREKLATTPPVTDAERREREARAALQSVTWSSRDLARAKARARKAGATKGQVAEAKRRGRTNAGGAA